MLRRRGKEQSRGKKDEIESDSEPTGGSGGKVEFDCKKCGAHNVVKGSKGRKKKQCCAGWVWSWLLVFFALVGASDYARRANLSGRVQDVLKTKLNVTLPDMRPPDLLSNLTVFGISSNKTERIGVRLRKEGMRPKHPVVIVPGFVTTGLELWAAKPCAAKHFRQRLWGTLNMPQAILSDARCWVAHMGLNQSTGLDPEGVALRASEGLAAVDFLMPSYFVWAKIIEALADLGYDTNTLVGETYDWRLSIANMERRDGYFTRLKLRVEMLHGLQKEKVCITAHSWGENVVRNFYHWVERKESGWVEKHVAAYINIAGTVLGVPKALTALLSGEMRDTAELGAMTKHAAENYLPQPSRAHMFRSWGSVIGMLPAGGNRVWGNLTWAPDDNRPMHRANSSYGAFLTKLDIDGETHPGLWERLNRAVDRITGRSNERSNSDSTSSGDPNSGYDADPGWKQLDLESAMGILLEEGAFGTSPELHSNIGKWGTVTGPGGKQYGKRYDKEADVYAHDPMNDPLPNAPGMKMFCAYGVDKPVERAYLYLKQTDPETINKTTQAEEASREEGVPLQWSIATEISNATTFLDSGVRKGNGDGTVPIISLGVHCRKGWKTKRLNPGGIQIKTRELPHRPVPMYQDPRGGPSTSDHVDVLGNHGLLDLILHVASGNGDKIEDDIVSDIDKIAEQIDFESNY